MVTSHVTIIEMLPLLTGLRHAIRGLRRSPALAAIGIASLALGIGANVTIYSVVREMILDDLSARQPDRLARIPTEITYGRYRDLRHAGVFQDLAFETGIGNLNWDVGTHSEVIWGMHTSANFFDVLGVGASAGRLYSQSDEGLPVAVVSYGFWRKRLGSDPAAVGRPYQVNGKLYTVLGVLPRDYRSVMGRGVSPEIYVPDPPGWSYHPFGRLRDGLTGTRRSRPWLPRPRQSAARTSPSRSPASGPWADSPRMRPRRRRPALLRVFRDALRHGSHARGDRVLERRRIAAGARRHPPTGTGHSQGARRQPPAIGASASAEGSVIVGLGAAAGLIVDAFLRDRLSYVRWPSAYNLPFEFHFQSDRGLFLYALATAMAALLVSSLLPSLRGSNADLGLAMKQGEPAFSLRRWNLRNSFVALQVALSMVLLTLGVLFSRSFLQIAGLDPGFDVSHEVIALVAPRPGQHQGEKGWSWRDGVVRRVKEVPGVMGVTSIGTLPFMGELGQDPVRRKGDPLSVARDAYSVGAGEQFCAVLGIRLLRGRDFEIADRTRQPVPALVNQTLARRLFGDADPVGSQLLVGREFAGREFAGREKERVLEIIGVTADAKMRTLGEGHAPVFFTPYADSQLVVRVAGNPPQWITPLRSALAQVDAVSALDVRPLSDATAGAIFPMRVAAGLVGSLSALGLLLVLTGLYSSVSYATRRRTREMAIRAAVGATRSAILWTAIQDGAAVLACGVVVGLPLAVAAIRPLTDILPDGVNPWDPAMFSAVGALLLATGAAAAWIPARTAAGVDPSLALRQE